MQDTEHFYSYLHELVEDSLPPTTHTLKVADSWLVDDGRVRSLQAHYDRFQNSIEDDEILQLLPQFFASVTDKLPHTGRWFPRIELYETDDGGFSLNLRLRIAPDQLGAITLWTHPEPDPRSNPRIKGPDLSLGMQLRRAAQMHGADEAVILDQEGYICEGALSALLWWRDDVLCSSSDELPWLPSITRSEIFSIAEQMGLSTRTEKVKPADLVGLEIWAVNSLQGIRGVANWVELGSPVGTARHLEAFNKRLRMLAAAI